MGPRMRSPLVVLASAALPEGALVCRLASDLLKSGVTIPKTEDAGRGNAKEFLRSIRVAVKEAALPRGRVRKSEADVAEEMKRQLKIRVERAARRAQGHDLLNTNDSYAEYSRRDKYRRMSMVINRVRGGEIPDCTDFVKVDGHLCVFSSSFMSGMTLLVRHPCGTYTEIRVGSGRRRIHEALMEMAGYLVSREAYLSGAAVAFNLCRAVFVVTHSDGRVEEIPFNENPVEVCS